MTKLPAAQSADLPEPVARRGITGAQWRTLANNLFPGAKSESILMVWDYCVARKLDPLKKPCHIVPMNVKDANTGEYRYRDVVMPGIYEYRTTAQRTGEYLGHSIPEYGPLVQYKGVMAPEWCSMTIYRWNSAAKERCEYPVRVYFAEIAATKKDGSINERWTKSPIQMHTKCTEAAGLREAFPEELGGLHTVEEMDGRTINVDGRGDTEARDAYVQKFRDALDSENREDVAKIHEDLNREDQDLYRSVWTQIHSTDRRNIKVMIASAKARAALQDKATIAADAEYVRAETEKLE